jgi:hypothetical protein
MPAGPDSKPRAETRWSLACPRWLCLWLGWSLILWGGITFLTLLDRTFLVGRCGTNGFSTNIIWYLLFIIVMPSLRIRARGFSEEQNEVINTLFRSGRFDISKLDYGRLIDWANCWLRRGQWLILLIALIFSLRWSAEALRSYKPSWTGITEIFPSSICCLFHNWYGVMGPWSDLYSRFLDPACFIVYCPTIALYYVGLFAFPVVFFTIFLWFFRAIIWSWLVWRLSRWKRGLQLNVFHPDGVGGLGVFNQSCFAWGIYVIYVGLIVAAAYLDRIYITDETVSDWFMWSILSAFFVFGPGIFLVPPLAMTKYLRRAKRQSEQDISVLISHQLANLQQSNISSELISNNSMPNNMLDQLSSSYKLYNYLPKMRVLPVDLNTYKQIILSIIPPLAAFIEPKLKIISSVFK